METFHNAIRLRVVGSGGVVMDPEGGGELLPESTRKLRPAVRNNMVGDAKPRDPMTDQRFGTG